MAEKIIDIEQLAQDQHNFNKGSEQGQELMERSFKEMGAGRSILIDKNGNIIAGNKSQKAAIAAGIKKVRIIETTGDELVAVKRTDVDIDSAEGRKMAYLDNLTTQVNLTWDETELQAVQADVEGFDVADFGFDIEDLPQVTFPTGEKQGEGKTETQTEVKEDDFDPDAHYETKVKAGEVWQLGEHRLMCGDSTKAEDFEKLMAGEKADLTFTSPPYNGDNASADGDIFVGKGKQRLYADGYSDNLESSEYVKFAESVLAMCFKHTDGFIFWNVNYNSNSKFEYIQQIVKFLPALVEQVCWKKSSAIPFKGCMRRGWEPVYIFSTTGKNLGLKEVETNIWEISNTNSQGADHKACFPVALPAKGISLVPAKSGIVLEPFGGTGTTMIACEQLGRKCRMMELDPHYCTVIIARWEKLTGQKAVKLNL